MHDRILLATLGLSFGLAAPPDAFASSHKPTDFPLRVAILGYAGRDRTVAGMYESGEGEGRADLFENGQPHALDFHYNCPKRLRASVGYETYMARWKKVRHELELLIPEIGKPGSTFICKLLVDVRETQAYVALTGGETAVIPAPSYKLWMDRAQYDPEQGKDKPLFPLRLDPNGGRPAPSTATARPSEPTGP